MVLLILSSFHDLIVYIPGSNCMKILQLCTDLRLGGVERFVLDLSQELARMGHEVILATTWSEQFDEMSVLNGEKPLFKRIHFGKTKGGRSLDILWKVNRLIWRERPDVVHTHLFTLGYVLPSVLLGLPRKTKYVHTVHSQADKEWPTPYYRLTKHLYLHCATPVSISKTVQETMQWRYPNVKTPLILNGCCLDNSNEDESLVEKLRSLRKSGQTRVFLHVGHLNPNKNQLMLNRVTIRLAKEGYDFAVAIVGREDDQDYSRRFLQEKCANVHYLGPCRHAQALLREADFFTLCSGYEGMPISLIEAIGNACVPVCTPAGGIPCACVNHVNGLLSEENTEDGLYRIMKEALELPQETYSTYGVASKRLFEEKFSMKACVEAYLRIYIGDAK